MKNISVKNIVIALLFLVGTELTGFFSAMLAGDIPAFYNNLVKPPLSPPDWLFGIVWPLLYALMAFAAFIVYRKNSENTKKALVMYFVQLALNFAWSIIFFRFDSLWFAFGVIVALLLALGGTILFFNKVSKTSALLLLPYMMWLFFATYLNIGTALLN